MSEGRQLIFVITAFALLAGWFAVGILPRHWEAKRLRAEITRLEHWPTREAVLRAEVEKLSALAAEAEALFAKFPEAGQQNSGQMLAILSEAATSAQVQLTKFTPVGGMTDGGTERTARRVQVSWSGPYPQSMRLLRSVEGSPHFLRITTFVCRKKDANGEILEIEAVCEEAN